MFKQIVNTLFTRILTGVLNLVIAIVISNYLGAEGKGVQGLIIATISLLIVFTGIVGPGGLTFLLPRLESFLLIIPSFIWSILSILVMWLVLWYFPLVPDGFIVDVLILSFILSAFNINNSILIARKRIGTSNLLTVVQVGLIIIVIFLYVVFDFISIKSYINALYVGYFISMSLSFWYVRNEYKAFSFKADSSTFFSAFRQLIKYGGFNQLDILAQFLSFRLAYYLLNYFIDPAQVGIYSNGVSIIESVWLLSRSISFVLHSQLVNSHDNKYSSQLTIKFMKFSFLLALIAVVILLFIPSSFYRFVFGEEFGQIRTVIVVLSPGVIMFSLSFVLSSYFSGTGKHYVNSISSIVGLISIVLCSLFLIPDFGIIGAGLAASISYLVTTIIKFSYFLMISKSKINDMIYKKSDFNSLKSLLSSSFNN